MDIIYCVKAKDGLNFYLKSNNETYFMFVNKFYKSIYDVFKNPVNILEATDYKTSKYCKKRKPKRRGHSKLAYHQGHTYYYNHHILNVIDRIRLSIEFLSKYEGYKNLYLTKKDDNKGKTKQQNHTNQKKYERTFSYVN